MIHVTRLQVTSVKGTAMHEPATVALDAHGADSDRRFYIIDERGLLFNGKHDGRLVQIRAMYEPNNERLVLRFPDGEVVEGVWTPGDPITTNFYGEPVTGRRAIGPWSEALSRFVGRTVALIAVNRYRSAVDVHPVTLISTASIERLRRQSAENARLDYRRFRMLVEVDGIGAHEEDAWVGRRLRIGTTVVEAVGPVPRCVVTSQDPETGHSDGDTLKAILAYRGARSADLATPTAHLPDGGKIVFGVYGKVVRPGRIAVGDEVRALEAPSERAPELSSLS